MAERKTIREEEFVLNPDLKANYSTFEDGFIFPRPDMGWKHLHPREWIEPVNNLSITEPMAEGVEFEFCQHVSVAVAGDATYQLEGPRTMLPFEWTVGTHNVENGGGYLPLGRFVRVFRNGFTLCCILATPGADPMARYRFEVITETKVLDEAAVFLHHCAGIRQKQTDHDLPSGSEVLLTEGDIAIVCYWD